MRIQWVRMTAVVLAALLGSVCMADEKARAVLDEAAEALAGHDGFTVSGLLSYRGEYGGDSEIMDTEYSVAFRRPESIAIRVLNREIDIHFYGDGQDVITYIPEFKQYRVEEGATSAAQLVADSGFELVAPVLQLMGQLVRPRAFEEDAGAPDHLMYVGEEEWEGYACDRVRFDSGGYTFDVWVEKSPDRLVRRIEPDMAPLEETYSGQHGMDFDFSVAAELTTWELDNVDEEATAFAPASDEEKVARFSPPQPKTPAEELKGEPAPDFTLAMLDGGELTLSKQRGDVIILDFWATWCGPCRVAMPVLEKVSLEYADKGVRLYGVNVGEQAQDVKRYLSGKGLDVAVLLDSDTEVSARFKVQGIPQTVIVGADGTVKIVHVGLWAMPPNAPNASPEEQDRLFAEALADTLREELDALLGSSTSGD